MIRLFRMEPRRLFCNFHYLLAVALIGISGSNSAWGNDHTDATKVAAAAATGDLEALKALLETTPALVSSRVTVPAAATEQFPGIRVDPSSIGTIGLDLAPEKEHSPRGGYGGLTPLHLATLKSHKDIVDFLLAHKADVNETDDGGWTPLIYAASFSGPKEIAEVLIAHGARMDIKDHAKLTALHWAARHANTAVAGALLLHKANVDARGTDLKTPYAGRFWNPPERRDGDAIAFLRSRCQRERPPWHHPFTCCGLYGQRRRFIFAFK
jgi:hypothetical protein